MDFERLEKMAPEEYRAYLRTLSFMERLELAAKLAERLSNQVSTAFPEAAAIVEEGELRSDRSSSEIAESEIDRIRRLR